MKSIDSIAAACYAFIIQLMEIEDLVLWYFPTFLELLSIHLHLFNL